MTDLRPLLLAVLAACTGSKPADDTGAREAPIGETDTDTDPVTTPPTEPTGEACGDEICKEPYHCVYCARAPPDSGVPYEGFYLCVEEDVTCGRPLRTCAGRAVASVRGDVPGTGDARALADLWLTLALEEHASIASFARQALALMAHGAPLDLVARTQRASLDEVRHAQAALALARRFAGAELALGAIPLARVDMPRDLAALAVETFVDGCLGETLATAVAVRARQRATDPDVIAALDDVIRDETRHAALAWATVAWAIPAGGPSVADAVEAAWRAWSPPAPRFDHAEHLAGFGAWSAADERAALVDARAAVLEPAVAALLGAVGGRPVATA